MRPGKVDPSFPWEPFVARVEAGLAGPAGPARLESLQRLLGVLPKDDEDATKELGATL